jgi:hypothetical protein
MRMVADHEQFVVHRVLMTSSKTVGPRSIRPRARGRPGQGRVCRSQRVEAGEVLVEAQQLPRQGEQPRPLRRSRAACLDRDLAWLRRAEPDRPGAAIAQGYRGLQRARLMIDALRGSVATPCEASVRRRSTGSPPAPAGPASLRRATRAPRQAPAGSLAESPIMPAGVPSPGSRARPAAGWPWPGGTTRHRCPGRHRGHAVRAGR